MELECVPKFCYLGYTIGAAEGAEEAARARASAKFKEISSILTARGESYRTKGKNLMACVQSLLTYETETWSTKKANLQNLERNKKMMVICNVM